MTTRVLRYVVPVDDRWHTLHLSGAVLHVAARVIDRLDVWVLDSGGPAVERAFRVYGTGQPLDAEGLQYRGTALAADGALVWHLFEAAA